MEFIRTIKEKFQTEREEEIQKLSEEVITLSDFDSTLFIAYNGTPLIPIEESWTSKKIVEELQKLRQNYIKGKMRNVC